MVRRNLNSCLCIAAFVFVACSSSKAAVLKTASNFAVLGGTTVTNTGQTVLNGDLGLSPGSSITGTGTMSLISPSAIHNNDMIAAQAKLDLTNAYQSLENLPFTIDLTGTDLGGLTLFPGVYRFSSSAQITGTLVLNAQNNPNALFVFQIGSTLNETVNSNVQVIGGTPGTGIFFLVGSSATLNTNASFAGNILADQSITLNTGASILCGRALAQNGAVTLDTNAISDNCSFNNGTGRDDFGSFGFSGQSVPEPGAGLLLSAGCLALVGKWWLEQRHGSSPR